MGERERKLLMLLVRLLIDIFSFLLFPSLFPSAIDSFELALTKQGKKFEPLSVQQVIDCVKTATSDGCNGGAPMESAQQQRTHTRMRGAEK